MVFISDNPTDFGDKETNTLSAELEEEANERKVEINYYRTISDFVKEHATKVTFITTEWIKENLDFTRIEEIFNQIISEKNEYIREFHEGNLESNENATGYINATSYINSNVLDFFVYEMSDGRLLLNIEIEFEKEYEMEIERKVENDRSEYEYEYHINPRTGEMEYEPVYVPKIDDDIENGYNLIYPLFRAEFVITLKDKIVMDYNFKDWDWG